jgi:hypothetical protein
MPARKQSQGKCSYCGQEMTKSAITKHLPKCLQRQEVIAKAKKPKSPETLYHLRVQDAHLKDFWLDLEIRESATLNDLDDYLRAIWLECCGHMSQFSFGGWRGGEIAMSRKIAQVLKPGSELTHIYDFGTSSETLIHVVDTRTGNPVTTRPIALLARNLMPEDTCHKCEKPATHMCEECVIEEDTSGLLCDKHTETHDHDEYGDPVELVNSPRMGMCGYTGPADPPY